MIVRLALLGYDHPTPEKELEFSRMMRSLRKTIPGLVSVEIGRRLADQAPPMDRGVLPKSDPSASFSHGLLVQFESVEAYRNYVSHPDHVAASAFALNELGRRAIVLDFSPDGE